jgi:hypothetical protein
MPGENDRPKDDWLKTLLKVVLLIIVIAVGIVVVGFGLIVGICALGSRR